MTTPAPPVMTSAIARMDDGAEETQRLLGIVPGKVLATLHLGDAGTEQERLTNALRLGFTDGSVVEIADQMQQCCENRYLTTDDALADFVGATLLAIVIKDAPAQETEKHWIQHDIQFLELVTSIGPITFASHNEHNGYYEGFSLQLREPRVAAEPA